MPPSRLSEKLLLQNVACISTLGGEGGGRVFFLVRLYRSVLSQHINVARGVRQGGISLPMLCYFTFIIYIDSSGVRLLGLCLWVTLILCFIITLNANDTVLLAPYQGSIMACYFWYWIWFDFGRNENSLRVWSLAVTKKLYASDAVLGMFKILVAQTESFLSFKLQTNKCRDLMIINLLREWKTWDTLYARVNIPEWKFIHYTKVVTVTLFT